MLRIIATIPQLQRTGKSHANLQTVPINGFFGQRYCPSSFSHKVSLVLKSKGRNLMKHLTPGGQSVATMGLVFP